MIRTMAAFEYGNARLRAMMSRLLSSQDLEALGSANTLQGLIASLAETAYRKPVEAALARVSGMECISVALQRDLIDMIMKVRSFYDGSAGSLVAIVIQKYDVYNFKSLLRGLSKNATPAEILAIMLPVGELGYDMLTDLASATSPREAIDLTASMSLPLAQPMLSLRAEQPGADIAGMEMALDRWYFREAFQSLEVLQADVFVMQSALKLDLDVINLLTILRLLETPDEHDYPLARRNGDDLPTLFLGPGRLSIELLSQAANQTSLVAAVDSLGETPYAAALASGLEAYKNSFRLSEFETHLNRYRLHWMAELIIRDPLGIGVLLGFLALKTNEISNIRRAAQGISLGLSATDIISEMEMLR